MSRRLWSLLAGAVLATASACHGDRSPPAPSSLPEAEPSAPAEDLPPTRTPAEPPQSPYRRVWVVSREGSDAAKGTEQAPFRTIARALGVAEPGDLVTVKSGTYAEPLDLRVPGLRDGTAAAKITVRGEGRPRLVPAGTWALVNVHRPHWIVEGFELDSRGQDHAGVAFTGNTQGAVLRDCEIHGGSAATAVLVSAGANGLTLEGNHIHGFSRGQEDAHGVDINPGTRDITVRDNRIHDVSGDAIQCSGPEGFSSEPPASDLLIEGNDLSRTRENAVDIKTCHRVTVRRNQMHDFQDALPGGCLVVIHMSARDVVIEDNELSRGGKGIAVGGNHVGPVPTNIVIRRNRIHGMALGDTLEGIGIRLENSENAQVVDNTLSDLQGTALVVGFGTGGPTKNARLEGNIVRGERACSLGPFAPGFSSRRNTYVPGVSFDVLAQRATVDLGGWQKLGFDRDAVIQAAP
ncbi:MAG TPA: right-handed parallel beta-helix repeat-containing protein [Myxococcaceae bacterium]|nr:right-handed parallel beta-helix repeat-containing protein [Myxococcaceae bacterium]